MIRNVEHALERAKKHGLSLSEVLEGYGRERAPILPEPANDLSIDLLENSDGEPVGCCGHIDVCCVDCREDLSGETLRYGGESFYVSSLACPSCAEPVAEWRNR